jgi:hypothetical protein
MLKLIILNQPIIRYNPQTIDLDATLIPLITAFLPQRENMIKTCKMAYHLESLQDSQLRKTISQQPIITPIANFSIKYQQVNLAPQVILTYQTIRKKQHLLS